ncbi:hypothetical protein EYF80_058902 [Liparis tanakae]|uniref:Uncharacterized protein n=1 Tax=Liparis tanakae TaxID=230148 RepID=A0A4Z2ERE5_9TELE|nr:hypothetical protein EYF80_058902 [Liparis tanakae]
MQRDHLISPRLHLARVKSIPIRILDREEYNKQSSFYVLLQTPQWRRSGKERTGRHSDRKEAFLVGGRLKSPFACNVGKGGYAPHDWQRGQEATLTFLEGPRGRSSAVDSGFRGAAAALSSVFLFSSVGITPVLLFLLLLLLLLLLFLLPCSELLVLPRLNLVFTNVFTITQTYGDDVLERRHCYAVKGVRRLVGLNFTTSCLTPDP